MRAAALVRRATRWLDARMLGVDACAQQALVRAPRRAELWSGAPRWADASVLGGRMLEAALVADLLVLSELQRVSSAPLPRQDRQLGDGLAPGHKSTSTR